MFGFSNSIFRLFFSFLCKTSNQWKNIKCDINNNDDHSTENKEKMVCTPSELIAWVGSCSMLAIHEECRLSPERCCNLLVICRIQHSRHWVRDNVSCFIQLFSVIMVPLWIWWRIRECCFAFFQLCAGVYDIRFLHNNTNIVAVTIVGYSSNQQHEWMMGLILECISEFLLGNRKWILLKYVLFFFCLCNAISV